MPVNEPFKKKWTRFCETILREGGFAKPRLMFFKFGEDFEFCPRGGRVWEGIRAGFYFFKFGEIRNSATQLQIQSVPSFLWAGISPRFLGRVSFLSPGRDYTLGLPRVFCPRHPHSTFFNIIFVVSLSL